MYLALTEIFSTSFFSFRLQTEGSQFTMYTVLNKFIRLPPNVRFMPHFPSITSLMKITCLTLKYNYFCYPYIFKLTVLQKVFFFKVMLIINF